MGPGRDRCGDPFLYILLLLLPNFEFSFGLCTEATLCFYPASQSPHESELLVSRAQQDSGEDSGQGIRTALRGWERLPSSSEELLTLHPTQDQRLGFKEMEAFCRPCFRLPGSSFPLISQVCSLTLTQLGERPAKLSLQLVFEYPITNNYLKILGTPLSRLNKPSHLIAVVFCFVCFLLHFGLFFLKIMSVTYLIGLCAFPPPSG